MLNLRPMRFLSVEKVRLRHRESGEEHEAIVLNLDNQGERDDDLVSIHLCEFDASELFRELGKSLGEFGG